MVSYVNTNQSLEKTAERFHELFNNTGVGIFIVDKERIIIEANAAFCKIFGVSHEEIIGESALSLHTSYASYVNFANVAFNKVRQNETLNLEYQFKHKNDQPLWLRIAGDSIPSNEEVLWTITDITERIKAQEQLKQSEALLRNAEAISHLGSWEIDLKTRAVTWSEEMFNIFGKSRPEPLFEEFLLYLSINDRERLYQANERALSSGKSEELDFWINREDGSHAYIKSHRKAQYNDNGVPVKLLGTAMDVTQAHENEQRIRHLNESLHVEVEAQIEILREKDKQLQYQSRLAQMGEMVGMIAHQWRQPLAAISATTGLLSAKLLLDNFEKAEFGEEIERIEGYSSYLSQTINDFRNFFKLAKQEECTTLETIVQDTLGIAKPLLENHNILISTTFTCNKEIVTYRGELGQVVLALLKNSEDVLLERKVIEPIINISTTCIDDKAQITIEDNGGGIDKTVISHIFEPYFSTKVEKDGTGMGLSMSKTIVENHCRGELTVKNTLHGARFIITLPSIT